MRQHVHLWKEADRTWKHWGQGGGIERSVFADVWDVLDELRTGVTEIPQELETKFVIRVKLPSGPMLHVEVERIGHVTLRVLRLQMTEDGA